MGGQASPCAEATRHGHLSHLNCRLDHGATRHSLDLLIAYSTHSPEHRQLGTVPTSVDGEATLGQSRPGCLPPVPHAQEKNRVGCGVLGARVHTQEKQGPQPQVLTQEGCKASWAPAWWSTALGGSRKGLLSGKGRHRHLLRREASGMQGGLEAPPTAMGSGLWASAQSAHAAPMAPTAPTHLWSSASAQF